MMNVYHIHALQEFLRNRSVSQGDVKACVGQRQARAADDARVFVRVIDIAKGKDVDIVPQFFQGTFVHIDITRHTADVRLVGICHHSDSHGLIVQASGERVKQIGYDRIRIMTVKLILREKEYEVKPGMTLLDSLKKVNVLPESVIATRAGEMILEDEILKDGDVVKLIAVISGGSCHCE